MTSDDQNLNGPVPEIPLPEGAPAEPQPAAEPLPGDFVLPESASVPPATSSASSWPAKDASDNDKLMAGLAYATQIIVPVIVPAVMLLSDESKARPFQKFHAIQSLGFLVAGVIYEVLAAIVYILLSIISTLCLACVLWVLFLVPVVPALYYAWQAYKGLYFKIPFLTEFMVNSKWLEIPAE
ncbi:MAG TPA: DUF4870 domain-containing protein [Anaerolineae bacterium]|nr:DUF4870 domain-containing protein [Anaerolineae bacterium]